MEWWKTYFEGEKMGVCLGSEKGRKEHKRDQKSHGLGETKHS